jgi:cytochrome c-type biogenesis protein CcmF
MIHTTIGQLGHFLVILSFVTALVATGAYLKTTLAGPSAPDLGDWRRLARGAFYLHGLAVLGVAITLYTIVYNHYFEYHYAWSHSSRALPVQYMISCFWEGQEGSFLLWLFWNAVLGVILIRGHRKGSNWEAPVMTVFALVQAFLVSMILGVVLGDVKLGSTPFLLLKEAMPNAPVFTMDPNFIPKDGNGLNPLLQNYWMVIHPPTLFLGFALTLVPFAYCLAGLWRNEPLAWIRPALPWTLIGALVLGVGIMMGAYWAYETLNFGGYWNWDPVENAVYVPWLVLVAASHAMLTAKRSSTGLKAAIILSVSTFLLILYATFLTRSGILGNASVHSFTDLGLSGQLLVYLLAFIAVTIGVMSWKWKIIPSDAVETSVYTKEFWIFMGATVLCLAAFQVIIVTSIPAYNKFLEVFGVVSNLAPPADQIAFNNKFQVWFFVAIALLTGVGQFMWWGKLKFSANGPTTKPATANGPAIKATTGQIDWNALYIPAMLTLVVSAGAIVLGKVSNPVYMALLVASLFALFTNGTILLSVLRGKLRVSGGAVAHIGMALMLLGILFSAGYSKLVSLNNSGLAISKAEEFTRNGDKENKENVLLWLNQSVSMNGYLLTYRGKRVEVRDMPGFVEREAVSVIDGDFHGIAQRDISQNGKLYHKKGDTLGLYPENTFYEVEYRAPDGKVFSLYPRAQVNERMGLLASPDIRHQPGKDLYTFVSSVPDPNAENIWRKQESASVAMKDTFFVNDYVAILDNAIRTTEVDGIELAPTDVAMRAQVRVLDKDREVLMQPAFIIRNGTVARPPEVNEEVGVRLQLTEIDPGTGKFSFGIETTQRDYIVMKASEKPLINLLWIGTLIVALGFGMATVRRLRENAKTGENPVSKPAKSSRKTVVSR